MGEGVTAHVFLENDPQRGTKVTSRADVVTVLERNCLVVAAIGDGSDLGKILMKRHQMLQIQYIVSRLKTVRHTVIIRN